MGNSPSVRRNLMVYATVAVMALAAYSPALWNDFTNWDDNVNLTDNPFLIPLSWWGFQQLWLAPYENLYVPIFYLSYYLDLLVARGNPNPFVTHFVNLALHAAVSLLAAALLRKLWTRVDKVSSRVVSEQSTPFLIAWLTGALIFAIHPIQTEVVAWATGRKDLVAALCTLSSWLCWIKGEEASARRRFPYVVGAYALFLAAMLAKPAAVALPLAMIVTDWFAGVAAPKVLLKKYAPWLALGAIWTITTAGTQEVSPEAKAVLLPWWGRPFVATDALLFYLRKIMVPVGLVASYGRTPLEASRSPLFWTSPAIVAVSLFLLWRKRSVWGWCAAVFIAFVAPVLGVIPFAFQRYSTVADRYVYLSMLGVAGIVSAAFWRIAARVPQRASLLSGAGVAVAGILFVLSARQARVWRDSITLWEHNVRLAPRSAVAYANLAAAYAVKNRNEDAVAANKRALELDPNQERAHSNLGLLLAWRDETTAALYHLRRAIEIRPNFAAPYAHVGDCYVKQNRWQEAAEAYQQALERDPRNVKAIIGLSYCYFRRGRYAESEQKLQEGLLLRPTNPALWLSYGHLLYDTGRVQEALAMYRRVLEIDPSNQEAAQRMRALSAKVPPVSAPH